LPLFALGGIVCNKSIRIAGDGFTADIQAYMRQQHNVKIGERTAEDIKINVGSALPDLDNPPSDFIVRGPNLMTALPIEVPVSYQEIAHCHREIDIQSRFGCSERTRANSPELYADIVRNGIYLTWWRCIASWFGQTTDRKDRHSV